MGEIEVLIPSWNGAERLAEALGSLRGQTLRPDVCVVDNGSTDHTPEVLAEFAEVRSVRLERNAGFGPALNRGVGGSGARLLIFLNNDAVADRRFVEEVAAVQERTGAEMVAACLRRPDGRIETLGVEVDESLVAYDFLHGEPYGHHDPGAIGDPLAPSGGAGAFLREAFLEAGGFDEAIFAYLEDVDLGLRMRISGMRCAIAYRAFARHEHSGTLGARSEAKNFHLGWSRGYLLWKHGAGLGRRARLRGLVLDGCAYAGKALIDRNLGAFRGRLEARRRYRREERPPPDPRLEAVPLARVGLVEGLRRRLARRAG